MKGKVDRWSFIAAEAWRRPACRGAFLIALAFLVYLPALRAGFVWDDDTILTANPLIAARDGLRRLWFTTQPADFWPVTYSSLWLEWRIWGPHPAGYHLTNVLLHAGTVVLLWSVLRQWKIPGAFLAAALFAVHPVNVESVAWIAQRKNLLAMIFSLLCAGFFEKQGQRWQALSFLFFLLALLSKGSVAALPFGLLILIRFHRRLRWSDAARIAPFLAAAALSVAVNIWFQRHGTGAVIRSATLPERILGAGAVIWFYLGKAILPLHLAFYYPVWRIQAANVLWWLPLLGAIGFTAWLWSHRRDARSASVLWAWLFFVTSLVPVMGLTDVYFMKFSLVADHYEHLALLGVVSWAGAAWSEWASQAGRRTARSPGFPHALAAAAVAALGLMTWHRCLAFRSTSTLSAATLRENPASWLAHDNWGAALLDEGRLAEAQSHFGQGLRLNPDDPDLNYNEGSVLFKLGQPGAAIGPLQRALLFKPGFPNALNNLGNALAAVGRTSEAQRSYEDAIRLRPDNSEFHYDLALTLEKLRQPAEAARQFGAAVRINPDYVEAYHGLGVCEAEQGNLAAAVNDYQKAIRLKPDYPLAYNDEAIALARLGRPAEALARLQTALRLRPDFPEAHANAAIILAREGRLPEAIAHYRAALKIRPDDREARAGLEQALQEPSAAGGR